MRNLKSMRRYGYETPQPSLLSRISGAVKKQLGSSEQRIDLFATFGVCLIIIGCILLASMILPAAIEHETDHSRQVVAESRGEK